MPTLSNAIMLATQAHAGHTDKGGQPYILHPLRVMLRLATEEEQIVGVLHDLVEDCQGWTLHRLRQEGFADHLVDGEPYEAYVLRAGSNPIGRAVKLADLADNMDRSRLAQITAKDEERLARYARAVEALR